MIDETLLISCPGTNGGLLIGHGLGFERLSPRPMTGLFARDQSILCARQDDDGRAVLVCGGSSAGERLLSRTPLDLHDIFVLDGKTYVAATAQNGVLCFDEDWNLLTTWSLPGEQDSSHLNSIAFHGDRLLVSVFGRFDRYRQYKEGTVERGEVIDIITGQTFIKGLSQPHSLTVVDDYLCVCNSEMKEVRLYENGALVNVVPVPGYARGFAAGREKFYVGLSKSRNVDVRSDRHASIAVIDRGNLNLLMTIEVPADEIYDIRVIDHMPVNVLPGLLADMRVENDRLNELIRHYERGYESYKELSRALYDELCVASDRTILENIVRISWAKQVRDKYRDYFAG